jgi:hypothetical protein
MANPSEGAPASTLISKRIADLGGWRGETLSQVREKAEPAKTAKAKPKPAKKS